MTELEQALAPLVHMRGNCDHRALTMDEIDRILEAVRNIGPTLPALQFHRNAFVLEWPRVEIDPFHA